MFRRNPLDTSGIICDFCGQGGVVHLFTSQTIMIGGIPRMQFMACATCRDLIHQRNLRGLVTQAANMVPNAIRRQARIHFSGIYTELFNNLVADAPLQPSHIFDLHILRAVQKRIKCAFRFSPICTDLAFVQVHDRAWKPACLPCAARVLGSDDPTFIVGHPMIRTLRRNPDPDFTPEELGAIQRQAEKDYIKEWGGLCENCDGFMSVCEICDDINCDCRTCKCQVKQRYNPDDELRRLERDLAARPDDKETNEKFQRHRHRAGFPPHEHDCDRCVFLGTVDTDVYTGPEENCNIPGKDLYFCPAQSIGGSMIIRTSCQDSDYSSMPLDVYQFIMADVAVPETSLNAELDKTSSRRTHYHTIYRIARERGLIQ